MPTKAKGNIPGERGDACPQRGLLLVLTSAMSTYFFHQIFEKGPLSGNVQRTAAPLPPPPIMHLI